MVECKGRDRGQRTQNPAGQHPDRFCEFHIKISKLPCSVHSVRTSPTDFQACTPPVVSNNSGLNKANAWTAYWGCRVKLQQKLKVGARRQELKQRSWRSPSNWLVPQGLLSLLYYRIQDGQPGDNVPPTVGCTLP